MSSVSAWVLSILGIVIIGTLLDLLLPEGRMHKYIKSIFACLTILVIVLPLPSFFKNGFKLDNGSLISADFVLDESYLENADKIKLKYLASGLKKQLEDDGYHNCDIEINGKTEDFEIKISSVTINIKNLVIDSDKAHINKYEQIRGLTSTYLNIEKSVITII